MQLLYHCLLLKCLAEYWVFLIRNLMIRRKSQRIIFQSQRFSSKNQALRQQSIANVGHDVNDLRMGLDVELPSERSLQIRDSIEQNRETLISKKSIK
ncbi:hypothetical protein L3Y34_013735 [Caenorhabditis briggsae]|uniref:Uncharacterized protein n=1 Tax=Caenorhabditis briggsae TaxID=6238 RepID=A0AAE9A231_CAEBR|nr:hypothetical protein L3Y34_013735 [Caenorhabditis briggsae]